MTDPIQQAADELRRGNLVAFPTETVYGLGADATNPQAVEKIYATKGRPSNNPLIVHVFDATEASRWARTWDDRAENLAAHFWPGPLTLVVPKNPAIVDQATAGLSSVGLRVPNHPVALALLRAFAGPVAAPSANRSNRISPTSAQHVRDEFGATVPTVLDGGACQVGIESTVLDLTGSVARILRPGHISKAMLEQILNEPVQMPPNKAADGIGGLLSPGQLPIHYAPRAPAYRFDASQRPIVQTWMAVHPGAVVLALDGNMPADAVEYARQLYGRLRQTDAANPPAILIEMPPDEPTWAAVRDRLSRATKPIKLSDRES